MKDNKNAIAKIHRLMEVANAFPNTLKETINFNEEDYNEFSDFNETEDGINDDSNTALNKEEVPNVSQSNYIAKIRKMSLEGMRELADNPNNPDYETLRKILQFCDKNINSTNKSTNTNDIE